MELSIQEAMRMVFATSNWNSRMAQLRITMDWEKIMGTTINNYTNSVYLQKKTLIVSTDVPILKHELIANKTQLVKKINDFYNAEVVDDLKVR